MKTFNYNDKIVMFAEQDCKLKLPNGNYVQVYEAATEEELADIEEVYMVDDIIIDEETFTRRKLLHELKEINDWFLSTDYIPNKVVVGEWLETDERFIDYKTQRFIKRARQDEIKTLLGLPLN